MEESILSAIGDRGRSKAYYRFINNEAVTASALLKSGRQPVLQAASQQRAVLAIQDTTELDYTNPTLVRRAELMGRMISSRLPKDNQIGVVTLWRAYSLCFLIRQAYFAFKDGGNQ